MGWMFRNKRRTSNSSDNKISITTNTDTMYKIGADIGEINSNIKSFNGDIKHLKRRVNDCEKRIKNLEQKG